MVGPHAKNRIEYRPMQILVDNMVFALRMFTTELFDASGGVGDLESAIDWDMNLRMTELTTPRCIPRCLYDYRVHENRMSRTSEQETAAIAAVEAAIVRRGLDVELVVSEAGWGLRRRRPSARRLELP